MATKATLINASGDKKVVESGSTQANDLFGQGYKLFDANNPPKFDTPPIDSPNIIGTKDVMGGTIQFGETDPTTDKRFEKFTPLPADLPGVVNSSDAVVQQEKNVVDQVQTLSAPSVATQSAQNASDAYVQFLKDHAAQLEQQRQAQLDAINQQFEEAKKTTGEAQDKETATTAVALQRIGGYLGQSASAVGALNNLAVEHRAEMASLESKKANAINKANAAIDEKEFDNAKALAQEAKDLEQTINDRRNTFFDESLKILQETRLQESADQKARQDAFSNQLDIIDRITPTVVSAFQDMTSESEAVNYLRAIARDNGVDPDLLLGSVNAELAKKTEAAQKDVVSLAQKYPDAGIDVQSDNFSEASDKIRKNSQSYQLDILKAETDIANTRSIIAKRASDAANAAANSKIDFSDPVLKLYTDATGEVISSTSKARGIIGYAQSLIGDKEIIDDERVPITPVPGKEKEARQSALLPNQILASDARDTIFQAFKSLKATNTGEEDITEGDVWRWLADDSGGLNLTDDQKAKFIMGAGMNPEDFGIIN